MAGGEGDAIDYMVGLLYLKQHITFGVSTSPDVQEPGLDLLHFRLFHEANSPFINSAEMHRDVAKTIYLAYTPSRSPTWYDTYEANDWGEEDHLLISGNSVERTKKFSELKDQNVQDSKWVSSSLAFPRGRGPATRWFKVSLPLMDPCARERARLEELYQQLNRLTTGYVPERAVEQRSREIEAWHMQHDQEIAQLEAKLMSNACNSRPVYDWPDFLRNSPRDQLERLIPHETPPMNDAGDYCGNDSVPRGFGALFYGFPAWNTILPLPTFRDGEELDNGEKRLYGRLIGWEQLVELMQSDPTAAQQVLRFTGHQTKDDAEDRSIPWISSSVKGIVTNSFLSGKDYEGSHEGAPDGYWLGVTLPLWHDNDCGGYDTLGLAARNQLCNDWIVFVRPYPEYRFLLTKDKDFFEADRCAHTGERHLPNTGCGNFDQEHGDGNQENEIEQWLIPVGFRPEPGDQIEMTGRWVIDCEHPNWQGELHPMESFISSHAYPETRQTVINNVVVRQAIGHVGVVASVVVTSDWHGGLPLELDIWPLARPSATAVLRWEREQEFSSDGQMQGIQEGLTVQEEFQPPPPDNPNHLHVTVQAESNALPQTHDWNQVKVPVVTRRLATKYRVWWEERLPVPGARE